MSCILAAGLCAAPGRSQTLPDDPQFGLQWGLHNTGQVVEGTAGIAGADIDALAAWATYMGNRSVVVAIVGTGVDPHPEFADRLLPGRAFTGDPFDTRDTHQAGTHAAGIVGAGTNDGLGVAGIAARVRLLPVRVLQGTSGTERDTADGIRWATDHGARVILVPLTFTQGTKRLAEAVEYATDHGALLVAPTGNGANNVIRYPAAFAGCVAVSATDNTDALSGVSNYGPGVDLAAPGHGIRSTWPGGGYGYRSGASAASAFVAGAAALVWSYAPQLTADEVRQILLDSADDLGDPGPDDLFGAGRLNARRALDIAPLPAVRFEHVRALPNNIAPTAPAAFSIHIAAGAEQVDEGSVQIAYRTDGGAFTFATLASAGGGEFRVHLPPLPCGGLLEYFFSATGGGGATVTDPVDAPARLHRARLVTEEILFADDLETDRGWHTESFGEKTTGHWERVAPVATSAQPGYDFSPNEKRHCYVTGQHSGGGDGSADVDGGPVVLTSPVIALSAEDVEITYARWFYWSPGVGDEDFLTVDVSRNAGATWTVVETVASTAEWQTHTFRLSDFPALSGTSLQVRFWTQDAPSDSLTEAAVDEFRVIGLSCGGNPADLDGDGDVDLDDFATWWECLGGPASPAAAQCLERDLTQDGPVDLSDFAAFQDHYTAATR